MNSRPTHTLKSLLHPCIFVLKEGGKIKKDFLDYSLMILFTHSREVVRSPVTDDDIDCKSEGSNEGVIC